MSQQNRVICLTWTDKDQRMNLLLIVFIRQKNLA